ncbi:hypothetical protein PN36_10135 [Candidatus Thiomargarita nelsonii]|uniref:Uncharacterized protein n=1 Tax=Candidatus Thiomargarita nelsonii TaxID=1003181 RepID=A0A0A6PKT3_9GAMM|nr:hypothetical protein PN36_10135 [Candidatus Thiomargarita nelsonii]
MSVSFFTYCIDCSVNAPEIGDAGMMGAPSLEIVSDSFYTFGWIYDGLKAISLLPYSIESYKSFLETHQGHKIHMDDEQLPELNYEKLEHFELDTQGFIEGYYEMVSVETGALFRTSYDWESYRNFEERELSQAEINKFQQRIIPNCFESIYRGPPCLDPYEDLGRLIDFVKENAKHTLKVRLAACRRKP